MQVLHNLGCIQVDPVNVVSRSHELSLYNRAKDFRKVDLYKSLYQDYTLFEYWMQLYSIIPNEAFPYLKAVMEVPGDVHREISNHWHEDYRREHKQEIKLIRQHIIDNGPTSWLDIKEYPKAKAIQSWTGNDSQKAVLDFLWNTGEVQISHREGNRKYYDLTERMYPNSLLDQKVTPEQGYEYLAESYFKYFGLVRTANLSRSGRTRSKGIRAAFAKQLKDEKITQVQIGDAKTKYFVRTIEVEQLQAASGGHHQGINILSPLDPLVIDRQILLDVFDFYYRWEGYTPAEKRKFGYYNMPILFNGEFVGQIDMAKKKTKNDQERLETKSLHLNQESSKLKKLLNQEITEFSKFCLT